MRSLSYYLIPFYHLASSTNVRKMFVYLEVISLSLCKYLCMNSLRSFKVQPKGKWSIEEIQTGFEKFVQEHGHYPTALDIDRYEFLPSSRSIQRSYGGLVSIRRKLFPEEISNYTTGQYRGNVASVTYKRAQDYEEAFYEKLCRYIKPIAVHEHKIIRPGRVACDFFIYIDDKSGICLDLFYAKDIFSLRGVIAYKVSRYSTLSCPVVFVLIGNKTLTQENINEVIGSRNTGVPKHIKIMTEVVFWQNYMYSLQRVSKHFKRYYLPA